MNEENDAVQSSSAEEDIQKDPVQNGSEKGQDGAAEQEIVEAEFITESEMGNFYTGIVVSVHTAYCYIGRVRRGYETIATNGDVFCPTSRFPNGTPVKFAELNSDPRRPGKFRTEQIEALNTDLAIASSVEKKALALITLTQPTESAYHRMAKEVPHEDVEQAAKNLPFKEMLATFIRLTRDLDNSAEAADEFLRATFPSLGSFDVSFSVDGDIDEAAEEQKIQETIAGYAAADMPGQVVSLTNEWERFKGARKVFGLMKQNGTLRPDMIIPIKYLPEMLVACPVWYVTGKGDLQDLTRVADPTPDEAIKYFCDSVGTKNFAWLYQIYNRRTRPFSAFASRDIIPPALLAIMQSGRQMFDYLAIATPYHDQASREWADPKWLRNIDPFLLGFMKTLPYVFVLGRWSGTGLFPLFLDMIADTINHLRVNKNLLNNFLASSYWYRGNQKVTRASSDRGPIDDCLCAMRGAATNDVLLPFAEKVIAAFDEGKLFEFLREETEQLTAGEAAGQ
ncbi:hypothetical protein HZB94_00400 [Candidatus Falkowbacteria bacterium]|nr:hypothetical protein [Candidatus Falkowbacteria bacterium]